MLKAGKTRVEIYMGNTIDFVTKSSQVKVTIVKHTQIRLKLLTVKRSQKNRWHGQQVCDAIKQTYVKNDH